MFSCNKFLRKQVFFIFKELFVSFMEDEHFLWHIVLGLQALSSYEFHEAITISPIVVGDAHHIFTQQHVLIVLQLISISIILLIEALNI